ncbi:hypothetical protein Ahy_A03g014517 [Arachis hypogaea]|uniref:Aminotransferase-like plant mobile domain-containing protein n=1 Tax=Arachis hypogaea TaxID=3818 RepID=A0A445DXZ7_ARAHY|nr:hypothetical protein Ahy_A03g014517 [Arachis hypogaea]
MPRKQKYKDVDRPELHIIHYLSHPDYAWIRLPYLAPVPREPRSFPLANRWRNWERGDRRFRYLTLEHFRKNLDYLQEGQFVWLAYAVDRIDPDIIPTDIYMHSVMWSATVPLVSFEIIEWHTTDRFMRQFGFVQRVPHQEWNLDKTHRMVLTGPKNLNWAMATTHSFWVMQWTNRYNHILTELPMPPQHPLDIYMYWYHVRYGNHLNLSDRLDSGDGASFSQLLGFMAAEAGQSQYGHQPDIMPGRYSLDAMDPYRISSVSTGWLVSGDSSRSDGGRGILNSQNPHRVSKGLIEENANTADLEMDEYLVDTPDDEDDDEEKDEEMDEDEESNNDASGDGEGACLIIALIFNQLIILYSFTVDLLILYACWVI